MEFAEEYVDTLDYGLDELSGVVSVMASKSKGCFFVI